MPLPKKLASEFIGTFFLLVIVVGSGIMGERLAEGNTAIALLANSIATGLGLTTLILVFAPVSGAEFNPLVTASNAALGHRTTNELLLFAVAQLMGALIGVVATHFMFELPWIEFSQHQRNGLGQLFSEFVATFGLFLVIRCTDKNHTPFCVGAYIAAAYWFTSSTSFANPTVTIARAFTPTFSGIAPNDILGFIIAQTLGAIAATLVSNWLRTHK